MNWQLILHLFIFSFSGTVHGEVQDQLVILTANNQILHSYVGAIVSLPCEVVNLNNHKLNWVFVKHSLTIFHGGQLMVDDPRYSISHPPDRRDTDFWALSEQITESNRYSLQILSAEVADQGIYKCQIDGTQQAVTMELVLLDSPVSPNVETPSTAMNHTACCQQRNVSDACLPACHPSSAPDSVDYTVTCAADLNSLIYCGSDGRNHENCCARLGVLPRCLLFCSNDQEGMAQLTIDDLICLNFTDSIISCYELGGVSLPSAPQNLAVLTVSQNGSSNLLISWKPPLYNPSAVSGYRVYYRKYTEARFRVTKVLNAATNQYSLTADINTWYAIYVVAVAHHGSSQPTNVIEVVTEDTSSEGFATDVLGCCQQRKVSTKCQSTLCHPRLWSTFNTTDMLQCYGFLQDVFSCLAGERNNTDCCVNNNVPDGCLGMCSGSPPPFNKSLAICIPKLSIIEACVQRGLNSQPRAPQAVTLTRIEAHLAVVSWTEPNMTESGSITSYLVQLRRGNEMAPWTTVLEVTGTFVELENLTETENYAVRVISQTNNSISLPSAVVRFTTYPELTSSERPTVAHNLTQCCIDSGMPPECYTGCQYFANITTYYASVLSTCITHIGTALSCAADGRDHKPCCRQHGVEGLCSDLCAYSTPGPLNYLYLSCIADTAKIVMCYKEGLEDLVRMPEDVIETNVTSYTITLVWKNPETGPRPTGYIVAYTNLMYKEGKKNRTTGLTYILQDLSPASTYTITVTSYLNDSLSPPSPNMTVFTPDIDLEFPFVPDVPSNTSRMLWSNRTHCCQTSSIDPACQPVCLNQPLANATDCSGEYHNILTCAADGKDHSLCCQEDGLPKDCLPFCSSHSATNFSVHLAGCLADANVNIITSCFLSYSGLLPSMPSSFTAHTAQSYSGIQVRLMWLAATNCNPVDDQCAYSVHFWKTDNASLSSYTTIQNVTSPYNVTGLLEGVQYTFTVMAHNSKGSGPAAPWQTLYVTHITPEITILQQPKDDILEQGTSVTLICDAFGFQEAPVFTWHLRDQVLNVTGHELRLTNLSKRSEANYSCTASSSGVNITAERFVNVRFKPEFNYFRTDSISPNIGAEAVLACWFRGHPDISDTISIWTKDENPVVRSSRLSASAKHRLHTGITAFRMKIANVVPADYGLYQCNVSNQYGFATANTKLTDPSKMPTPAPLTPSEKRNVSACCSAKGVNSMCMPLCTFEVSPEQAVSDPNYGICLLDISELVECAADGADHTLCCEAEQVPELCLPFCFGHVPHIESISNSQQLLQCIPHASKILDCMEKGYGKIPTAPRNVLASAIGNKIKVAWDPPERNADRVTSYDIYYNFTGNSVYQTETVTVDMGHQHTLNNIEINHRYDIWMRAERYAAGQSQNSNKVTVYVPGSLPAPPAGVNVIKITGTTVVISWQELPPESVQQEAFAVYYKPLNSVKYERKLTMDHSITLTDLQPKTTYTVYVKSNSRAGEGQPSETISFTTGEKGREKPIRGAQAHGNGELDGGQIAGIIVAIVAFLAILVLLVVLIKRNHIRRSKLTESVSFENPTFGDQRVHIGSQPSGAASEQTQPDKDGDFGYVRFKDEHASAVVTPSDISNSANSVPHFDYPNNNTQYPPDTDLQAVNTKAGYSSPAVLEVSKADGNSESMS